MRWIKASKAKKAYGIPDRIYREAIHGKGAIAFRPAGEHGHYYFDEDQLVELLNKKGAIR